MATIRQRNDRWQAIIKRKGYPTQSKSFDLRKDAEKWARQQERALDAGQWIDQTEAQRTTLDDLLERYAREVSVSKRGLQQEALRITVIRRSSLVKYAPAAITGKMIADYRDKRLEAVSGSTVNRELSLLSHLFTVATREWGIALHSNPVSLVRKPANGKARDRGLIKWEKLLTEKVDGKPNTTQLDNEVQLLAGIYEGKYGLKDVLNKTSTRDVTQGQMKYLLGEVRRVKNENATVAAAAGKADEAIFKTRDYQDAKDFVGSMLAPRPRDPSNFQGQQAIEFDRANAAQAQREFFTGLKGKAPAEIQPWAEDVVKRYKARQKDYTDPQQQAVAENKIPFKSLQEVRDAGARGLLSLSELRRYHEHFKAQ